jgi:hypothetical protein
LPFAILPESQTDYGLPFAMFVKRQKGFCLSFATLQHLKNDSHLPLATLVDSQTGSCLALATLGDGQKADFSSIGRSAGSLAPVVQAASSTIPFRGEGWGALPFSLDQLEEFLPQIQESHRWREFEKKSAASLNLRQILVI